MAIYYRFFFIFSPKIADLSKFTFIFVPEYHNFNIKFHYHEQDRIGQCDC